MMVTGSTIAAATSALPRQDSESTSDVKNETSILLKPPTSLALKNLNQPLDVAAGSFSNGKYSATGSTSASTAASASKVEVTVFHEKPKDEIELAKSRKRTTPTPSPADHHSGRSPHTQSSKSNDKSSGTSSPYSHKLHHSVGGGDPTSSISDPKGHVSSTQRRVTICDREIDLEQQDEDPESLLETKKIVKSKRSSLGKKGKSHGHQEKQSQDVDHGDQASGAASQRRKADVEKGMLDKDDDEATDAMAALSLAAHLHPDVVETDPDADMDFTYL